MTRSTVFAPFDLVEGDRKRGIVLLADHARRDLPEEYGSLGLPAAEFERHIAYDIGVEMVTRELAAALDVPAVIASFSRLLIDPNRGEDDPTLIRQLYDGTVVPGNYPMAPQERERRLDGFYRPYHDAVGAMIASVAQASGKAPFIFSVHSFTPVMQGRRASLACRHPVGSRRPRGAAADRHAGRGHDLVVGDNEPYDGALRGDTMYARHRQRLCPCADRDPPGSDRRRAGALAWAERLAPIVDAIDRRPDIHQVKMFGSRTGPL